MRPRTTALWALAALLLGVLVYLLEFRDPDAGATDPAAGDALFADLEATDVAWIELPTADGPVARAERTEGGWRIVAPGDWRADAVALDGVASQLVGLEVQGRVAGEGRLADFGVAPEQGPIRFEAAGCVRTLRLGGRTPVGGHTYARADDGDEVVWIASWRANALRKPLRDLRDRRVVDFDHAAVRGLDVRWPEGRVVVERTPAGWRLRRPVDERADRATVETLLSDLAFLTADDFLDAPTDAGAAGLDDPVLTVSLTLETLDAPIEVVFGDVRDGRRIVRGAGDALFLIDDERLADLPRDVLAYRFKALGEFDVAAARGLSLVFGASTGETAEAEAALAEDTEDTEDTDGTVTGPGAAATGPGAAVTGPGAAAAEAGAAAGDAPSRVDATLAAGRWQTAPWPVPEARVREIVSTLSRLDAIAIVAEEVGAHELAALGLRPARVEARVTGEGGDVLAEVALGVVQPGRGILAKRADSPILYRLDETVAERLPTGAADFAERFVGEADPPDDVEEPATPATGVPEA